MDWWWENAVFAFLVAVVTLAVAYAFHVAMGWPIATFVATFCVHYAGASWAEGDEP